MNEYDPDDRVAPCEDEHACKLTKIEVDFGLRVFMTREQQRRLLEVLEEIVDAPCNQPVEGVHWVAGIGSKPNLSAIDAALLGKDVGANPPADGEEPTFSDDVFQVESCAREFLPKRERERILAKRRGQ